MGLDQAHKNHSSRGKGRYLAFLNPVHTALLTLHSVKYCIDGEEGKSGLLHSRRVVLWCIHRSICKSGIDMEQDKHFLDHSKGYS